MKSRNWKWRVLLGAAISITLATPGVASSIDFVLENGVMFFNNHHLVRRTVISQQIKYL
jgi:hypothetical protein